MEPCRTMALNNAWANRVLQGALADLPPGAFTAPWPGFLPPLSATLNHILAADLYYLDALEEGGPGRAVHDRPEESDPAALAGLQADADLRFARFCDRLSARDLPRRGLAVRADATQVTERVEAVILHLVQHQIHHRGQAHVQPQHAGIAPPQLDAFCLDYDRAPDAAAHFG